MSEKWTPEWLATYGNANDWLQSICDAHNAALAAEREKSDDEARAFLVAATDLRELLAAEREKSRILGNMTNGFRSQLQDRHKLCVEFETKWKDERETVKALVEALENAHRELAACCGDAANRVAQIIDAALATVGVHGDQAGA
jgi:hypothetical protein